MHLLDKNNQYTIVGMGLTGLSCLKFFKAKGFDKVRICDSRNDPALALKVKNSFPEVEAFNGDLSGLTFTKNEIVIVSPGMALSEVVVKNAIAAGARISSDIELFLAVNKAKLIAVTGSNGKSTVVTLLGEIIKRAGLSVSVAGNIGLPVLDGFIENENVDFVVLELSSFQLERLSSVNALAVSLLNISEDHMDRYNSAADYIDAKKIIFTGAKNIIVNADETDICIDNENAQLVTFSLTADNTDFQLHEVGSKEWVFYQSTPLIAIDEMKIKGRHNISNVMAAMALAYKSGIQWDVMIDAVNNFTGLSHRCEWVAEVDGVEFFNDSKATNVGAAVAAINGLYQQDRDMILIAGGQDKNSDFLPLADAVKSSVKSVILLGQDADKIAVIIPEEKIQRVNDLSQAVSAAKSALNNSGTVLFSPACASFDMFNNFEHRGDAFKTAVFNLQAHHHKEGSC